MPSFVSRNILLCVVPTVIALVSAYWFRRKKKFKAVTHTDTIANVECSENSVTKVNSLSNTCSLDTEENTVKVVRTAQYSVSSARSSQSDDISVEISKLNQSDVDSLSNHIDALLENLQDTASFSSSLNTSSVQELDNKQSSTSDTTVDDSLSDNVNMPVKKTHHLNVNAQEFNYVMSENVLQSAEEECFKNSEFCRDFFNDSSVENLNLCRSAINDEDALEKLQDIKSNDSQSSVQEENGLSDDEIQRPYLSKNKDSFSSGLDGGSLSDETPPSRSDSGSHSINDLEEATITSCEDKVPLNSVVAAPAMENGMTSEILDSVISSEHDHVDAESQSGNVSPKDSGIFLSSPTNHYSTSSLTNSDDTVLLEETQQQEQPMTTWAQRVAGHSSSFTSSSLPIDQLNSNVQNGGYSNGIDETTSCGSIKDEDYRIQQLNVNEHLSDISHASSWSCYKNDNFKQSDVSSFFTYEFELPQELCGRLIGRAGRSVKFIKERSRANVFIKRHAFDPQLKVVVVEGRLLIPQIYVTNAFWLLDRFLQVCHCIATMCLLFYLFCYVLISCSADFFCIISHIVKLTLKELFYSGSFFLLSVVKKFPCMSFICRILHGVIEKLFL